MPIETKDSRVTTPPSNQSQAGDPVKAALDRYLPSFPAGPIEVEKVPIEKALGRISANDVKAAIDSPPYPRSIIEGFVVNTTDIQRVSEQTPVTLSIQGEITVGMSKAAPVPHGGAVQVSTGSLIPSGNMTVIRHSDVEQMGNKIIVKRPLQGSSNIETQGCDLKKGTTLLPKGKRLTPVDIGLLASQGILKVSVAKRPKVAIFSSGNEVIPPSKPFKPGFIWDSNAYALSASILEQGGIPSFKGIMKDDFNAFLNRLKKTLPQVDMILISGGTAVGGRDFIKELLNATGKPGTLIDGVPMRSGKPLIMGVVSKKPIVCVAGHPPEALRGFTLFGIPTLTRLLGKSSQ
jgi:molybdopterin molybdotransferase